MLLSPNATLEFLEITDCQTECGHNEKAICGHRTWAVKGGRHWQARNLVRWIDHGHSGMRRNTGHCRCEK